MPRSPPGSSSSNRRPPAAKRSETSTRPPALRPRGYQLRCPAAIPATADKEISRRVPMGAAPGALQDSLGYGRSSSASGAAAKTTPHHEGSGFPSRANDLPPLSAARGRRRSQVCPRRLTARPAPSWPGK
ncbi:hypothetical protein NDU88_006640 [Pleurodeles waltl]|uniref:Uncharacterized protein n=1 Tax=Pleurodeles waltl TaxID=8319 RepID=A0AAV7MDU3_PLEWA|nr:hypothetical protein NDU88_006640 [Pleurodeles waltl]